MGIVIHGEATGIHTHLALFARDKYFFGFSKGIVELHTEENQEKLGKNFQ
jgi:hypothetical protein